MEYQQAKYYLVKIIKFIQTYGYTNEKSSIHFNVSFNNVEKNLNDLNILKFILNIDEDEIYRIYPSRKNSVYAKSIKKIIPYKEYDFFNIPINAVKNNLRLPIDKYFGVNFLNFNNDKETQRIEFRYIGGKNYENNIGNLIYFMDRFTINTFDSIGVDFNSEDTNKLEEYLEENISLFKNLSKYDNFIVDFPSIQLQIDQVSNYDLISAYYPNIYTKLYNLVDTTSGLKECIINYVTSTQTMEVVDAEIKNTSTIKGYDLINCKCEGIYENCFFIGCSVDKAQMIKSKLKQSSVTNSKVLNCKVESTDLTNCYFVDGYLNGDMMGGVFRSGRLGPYATLDSEVKVITDSENFFDIKFEESPQKVTDKGIMKSYGKIIPGK